VRRSEFAAGAAGRDVASPAYGTPAGGLDGRIGREHFGHLGFDELQHAIDGFCN